MAKSMYEINMDFERAKQQADNLDDVAKNIQKMLNNDFVPCMQGISRNWKGENAGKYIKKGEKLQENMKKSVDKLKKTAETIRTIAENTYKAEKAAYEAAMARTYNK